MIRKKERRSKITTMAVRPSVYEKLQKISYMTHVPINAIINNFLENYVVEHQFTVDQYDKQYGVK